ncbi:envelope stress response protein PspG [Veronia pacifica]|uniref:Phage shock protein G n=1 Tax=Veronia pacifica TaxID=1080227 RepID=A0A1C3ED37_9GAMM|nr:envelope stress response protein PspG [Veronia pacifica]ODA31135.1 phage shock protein G [Veronia pacifica]
MTELLFLIGFGLALVMTGVSAIGIFAAIVVGFVIMAFAGMLGLLFKMLPWIILIAAVIWLCRGKDKSARRCRDYCYDRSRSYRKRYR